MNIKTLIPEKFTGIIQLVPSDASNLVVLQKLILEKYPLQSAIMKKGTPSFHITLLHQSVPKTYGQGPNRGDKLLKNLYKSGEHFSVGTPTLKLGSVFVSSQGDRRSTYVIIDNADLCTETRDNIMSAAGIDTAMLNMPDSETNRVFHISLTNLTGNSSDSIAYPQSSDTLLRLQ